MPSRRSLMICVAFAVALILVGRGLQLDLLTLPRALKRGLPDVGTPAGGGVHNPTHAMSAVQQRLARLKTGGS